MVGPQRPHFVLFGSSIVQLSFSNGGWGATLANIYARKADIILRGYNGWNTRQAIRVLDKIFPKDAATQPALVIVYFGGVKHHELYEFHTPMRVWTRLFIIGGNDSMGPHPSGLGPHVPLAEYIENLRKIATHLMSLSGSVRLIFLSCPPINEAMIRESPFFSKIIRTNDLLHTYSEACIELCKDMGIKVIDLWSEIQRRQDWLTTCFTDGIHLSEEGSKIVVDQILKVLKEAEWTPSLHWKSMPTEFLEESRL